jgi:hypothetical protein
LSLSMKRAQGTPDAGRTREPCVQKTVHSRARKQRQGSRNNRRSLRNGLRLIRVLLGAPGFLATVALANVCERLIPASGDRDRTISPSARMLSSARERCGILTSIASRLHVRDDRDTPLRSRRDARTIRMIWVSDKEKYFSPQGLTSFRKISPSGKSLL